MDRDELHNLNVAVLAGGWSDERSISLDSGRACARALKEAGFARVELLDVAADDFARSISTGSYDVAFVALHGPFGEDGCIQGFLEILHIPYTFSGVLGSAVGTEKEVAKVIYRAAGIPCPRGITLAAGEALDDSLRDQLIEELGLPLFVKPAANGSSYGITRVSDPVQFAAAVERAAQGGCPVLIEECITGTEITVPVIGNRDPQALPVVEIVTGAEFYDLKVKYEPAALHHVIPARLSQEAASLAQARAVAAHKALGCRGCSRSDFIVTSEGEPVILETNTIPGMTETSLLPDSARHAGIEFPELCTRFIELALEG
ncbi:D-alanine--D-alanine ligase [Coriobacteriales bacterium OH1046]|nr:D-alanine--D-alanine ligase [Coriobacteriales bacterium OH1046]